MKNTAKFYIIEKEDFISINLKGHFVEEKHCAFFTGAFYVIEKLLSKNAKSISRSGNTLVESKDPKDLILLEKFISFILEWITICEQENPYYKIPVAYNQKQ